MGHFKRVLFTFVLILSIHIQLKAEDGTAAGGGGSVIENQFKSVATVLVDCIRKYTPEAKKLLLFDPNVVWVKLNYDLKPHCAVGNVQKILSKKNKMAMVFEQNPNVVELDCGEKITDADIYRWQKYLINPQNFGFVLHEIVRVAYPKNELEDNYSISGSWLLAFKKQQEQLINWQKAANANCYQSYLDKYKLTSQIIKLSSKEVAIPVIAASAMSAALLRSPGAAFFLVVTEATAAVAAGGMFEPANNYLSKVTLAIQEVMTNHIGVGVQELTQMINNSFYADRTEPCCYKPNLFTQLHRQELSTKEVFTAIQKMLVQKSLCEADGSAYNRTDFTDLIINSVIEMRK